MKYISIKMKKTKVDFYSINNKGNHLYEFSSLTDLDKKKPLTKTIIETSIKININIKEVKEHRRNYLHYKNPITDTKIFKQKNVITLYCNKAKGEF